MYPLQYHLKNNLTLVTNSNKNLIIIIFNIMIISTNNIRVTTVTTIYNLTHKIQKLFMMALKLKLNI